MLNPQRFINFLFASLLLAVCLFGSLSAQTADKIRGIVTDAVTGEPLPGANIRVLGMGTGAAADANGRFAIPALLIGTYALKAEFMGYTPVIKRDIYVNGDEPAFVSFRLHPGVLELPSVQIVGWRDREDQAIVIDAQDISQSQAQHVGELLTTVAGVLISQESDRLTVSIRGSQSNQVLVLLDGNRLNDELSGSVDLSQIPVSMIERIEVYKGGHSSRFGSGALGGVINIITKHVFANQYQMTGVVGSYGNVSGSAAFGKQGEHTHAMMMYQHAESQNKFPFSYSSFNDEQRTERRRNADVQSSNLFLKTGVQWRHHRFDVKAQWYGSERGLPGKIHYWTGYARSVHERRVLGSQYQMTAERWIFNVNLEHSSQTSENSNLWPSTAPLRDRRYPHFDIRTNLNRTSGSGTLFFQPTDWLDIKSGVELSTVHFRDQDVLNANTPVGMAENTVRSAFIRPHVSYEHKRVRVSLSPSIRYDTADLNHHLNSRRERQWSPALDASITTGQSHQIILRTNVNRSFRAPTFADLYYQDFRVQGKADLKPETSRNVQGGVGVSLFDGAWRGDMTVFHNRINDLIVWRLGHLETFTPFNTNADIRGREYLLEYTSSNNVVSLNAGFTEIWARNKSSSRTTHNKLLPYRPRNSFKTGLRLHWRGWNSSMQYQYIGERFITEANTILMPAYQVFDANLSYTQAFDSWDVTLKISGYNLLNETYEIIEDMPLPPRQWRIGLSFTK